MQLIVIDGNATWEFDTSKNNKDEMFSYFNLLKKEGRTFKSMELQFKEGTTLNDVNDILASQNGEGQVLTQTLILNPKEE